MKKVSGIILDQEEIAEAIVEYIRSDLNDDMAEFADIVWQDVSFVTTINVDTGEAMVEAGAEPNPFGCSCKSAREPASCDPLKPR